MPVVAGCSAGGAGGRAGPRQKHVERTLTAPLTRRTVHYGSRLDGNELEPCGSGLQYFVINRMSRGTNAASSSSVVCAGWVSGRDREGKKEPPVRGMGSTGEKGGGDV